MKLSEAILLGSVSTIQGRGGANASPLSITPCAIGTALAAVGSQVGYEEAYEDLQQRWPWVSKQLGLPKEIESDLVDYWWKSLKVYEVIWRLNDKLGWPRPRIAEWIASIEPQDEIASEPIIQEEVFHEAK